MAAKYFHSKAQCNFVRHLRYEMKNHSKLFNVILLEHISFQCFLGRFKIWKILEVTFFRQKTPGICRGCQAKLAAESESG